MKNKRFLFFLLILTIVVLCIVTYFITRPQPEELYPQVFAKMPEKPELIQQFQHSLLITSVAISPTDPNLIAGVNNEGYIRIWNRKNIEDSRFLYHSGKFPSIRFSPTGKLLASADYETLILWDIDTRKKIKSLKTFRRQFAFLPDGKQVVTIHGGINFWDIRNPKEIKKVTTIPYEGTFIDGISICAIDISSDGKWIAVGGTQGTVYVWNLQTQQLVTSLEISLYMMEYLKFSPNKKYMVAGGNDWGMYSIHAVKGYVMWEVPSWIRKGEVFRGHVENFVFSPDGKMCVAANDWAHHGRGVEIWLTENGAPISSLPTEARDVSFSQDGNLLVTGGMDGIVRVWDLTKRQLDLTNVRNDVVRLIYYLSKDKEPSPNITQKINKTIGKVQKHYADEMERHGFGRKTFTFETDQNGNAKIYLMEGNQAEFHDMQLNDIWLYFLDDSEGFWKVINENMLKRLNSVSTGRKFVDFNHTFIYPTKRKINVKGKMGMYDIKGFTGGSGIISVEKNDIDWKITAYLLKHRFAVLGPDHLYYRNERNVFKRIFNGINSIMPWNNNGVKLSKCEAEWLNKSRFFNPNQPFFDKRPEIEMKVLNEETDSPLFQFIAADEDGIHQLHLFVPDELKYQYRIDKLQGCKTINGKKNATVEFEIFNTEIKKGEIRMIDMHGNISSREFKYIEKTSEPDKEP